MPYYPHGCDQKGNQGYGYNILLFLDEIPLIGPESKRSRSWSQGLYFRPMVSELESESKSESCNIRRLRSPGRNVIHIAAGLKMLRSLTRDWFNLTTIRDNV